MEKEKVIKCINSKELDYSQNLREFFYYYQGVVDRLLQEYLKETDNSREGYMVNELRSWLEKEGYSLFYVTIGQLSNELNRKVRGFIEAYTFLLSNSTQNALKLIDELFCIPSQFAREFVKEQRTLIGEYMNNAIDIGKKQEVRYTFNNKGTFAKVPYFLEENKNYYGRMKYEY